MVYCVCNRIKWVGNIDVVMYGWVINLWLCGNIRSALLIVIFANMLQCWLINVIYFLFI